LRTARRRHQGNTAGGRPQSSVRLGIDPVTRAIVFARLCLCRLVTPLLVFPGGTDTDAEAEGDYD